MKRRGLAVALSLLLAMALGMTSFAAGPVKQGIFSGLTGSGTEDAQEAEREAAGVVERTEGEFTFEVPQEWEIFPSTGLAYYYYFDSAEEDRVFLCSRTGNTGALNRAEADEFFATYRQDMLGDDATLEYQTPIFTVNGYYASAISALTELNGEQYRLYDYCILGDAQSTSLSFVAPLDMWDFDMLYAFEKVIYSLKPIAGPRQAAGAPTGDGTSLEGNTEDPGTEDPVAVDPGTVEPEPEKFSYNGLTWGMSQAEVEAMQTEEPESSGFMEGTSANYVAYNTTVGDRDYLVGYFFEQDQLFLIRYFLMEVYWDGQDYIDSYNELCQMLNGAYGDPIEDEIYRFDTSIGEDEAASPEALMNDQVMYYSLYQVGEDTEIELEMYFDVEDQDVLIFLDFISTEIEPSEN